MVVLAEKAQRQQCRLTLAAAEAVVLQDLVDQEDEAAMF